MPSDELLRQGEHTMTVCNACRYCEGYCPVFPAVENRLTFLRGDLTYLANLCHNCGECLYACQYAPPHEFGINVPRTLAQLRLHSYEDYCWPRPLGVAFRRHGIRTALGTAMLLTLVLVGYSALFGLDPLLSANTDADFYRVVPHGLIVALFGGVSIFVVLAIVVGVTRFWRAGGSAPRPITLPVLLRAIGDAVSLKHLHGDGVDCTKSEEQRSPWRRWFHHCTVGGFMLCFASTAVAAIYHSAFGWHAPYGYFSAPVVLGTIGGLGLIVGPAGLLVIRRRRDPALGDPEQEGLETSFIVLLFLASFTGLLLLVARERPVMGTLLLVHLSVVFALFVTLPYGKFVHGIYRTTALVRYELEGLRSADDAVKAATNPTSRPSLPASVLPRPSIVPAASTTTVQMSLTDKATTTP